jgi:hypothetical protein
MQLFTHIHNRIKKIISSSQVDTNARFDQMIAATDPASSMRRLFFDPDVKDQGIKKLNQFATEYLSSRVSGTHINAQERGEILRGIAGLVDTVIHTKAKENMDDENFSSASQYLKVMTSILEKKQVCAKATEGQLDQFFRELSNARMACGSNLFGGVFNAFIALKLAEVSLTTANTAGRNEIDAMVDIVQGLLMVTYQETIDTKILPKVIRQIIPGEVGNHERNLVYDIMCGLDSLVGSFFPRHNDKYEVKGIYKKVVEAITKEGRDRYLSYPELIKSLCDVINGIQPVRLKVMEILYKQNSGDPDTEDPIDILKDKGLIHQFINTDGEKSLVVSPLGILEALKSLGMITDKVGQPEDVVSQPKSTLTLKEQFAVLAAFGEDEEILALINNSVSQGELTIDLFSEASTMANAGKSRYVESSLVRMVENNCRESLDRLFEIFTDQIAPTEDPFQITYINKENQQKQVIGSPVVIAAAELGSSGALAYILSRVDAPDQNKQSITIEALSKAPEKCRAKMITVAMTRSKPTVLEFSKMLEKITTDQELTKLVDELEKIIMQDEMQLYYIECIRSACIRGSVTQVKRLVDNAKFGISQRAINVLWESAINHNQLAVINILMDLDLNPTDKKGILECAISKKEILQLLLSKREYQVIAKAWKSSKGHTLVMKALIETSEKQKRSIQNPLKDIEAQEIIEILVKAGVSLEAESDAGLNSVYFAIWYNLPICLNYILECCPKLKDKKMSCQLETGVPAQVQIPLEMAIERQQSDNLIVLVQRDANLFQATTSRLTPFAMVLDSKNKALIPAMIANMTPAQIKAQISILETYIQKWIIVEPLAPLAFGVLELISEKADKGQDDGFKEYTKILFKRAIDKVGLEGSWSVLYSLIHNTKICKDYTIQSRVNRALYNATEGGHLDFVRQLMCAKPKPNPEEEYRIGETQNTALSIAITKISELTQDTQKSRVNDPELIKWLQIQSLLDLSHGPGRFMQYTTHDRSYSARAIIDGVTFEPEAEAPTSGCWPWRRKTRNPKPSSDT